MNQQAKDSFTVWWHLYYSKTKQKAKNTHFLFFLLSWLKLRRIVILQVSMSFVVFLEKWKIEYKSRRVAVW